MREEEEKINKIWCVLLFKLAILAHLDPPIIILYAVCNIVAANIHDTHDGCDERDDAPINHPPVF